MLQIVFLFILYPLTPHLDVTLFLRGLPYRTSNFNIILRCICSVIYYQRDMHFLGDVRVNEQPGLTSMHTLWVREHNRVVNDLVALHGYPEVTEADREILFQEARRIVIAEYQVRCLEIIDAKDWLLH